MKGDKRPMRITFTMDKRGFIRRICADEEVEVYIVSPHVPRDRVYRWSSLEVGRGHVDEEIDGWPVGDKDHLPAWHCPGCTHEKACVAAAPLGPRRGPRRRT